MLRIWRRDLLKNVIFLCSTVNKMHKIGLFFTIKGEL